MNTLQFKKDLLDMQDNMMSFALMLTANKEDALDLMQDTALKVLNSEEKFTSNINFKGWVLTIMRNIFINNYHKIIKYQTVVSQDVDLYSLNITKESGFDSPERAYAIGEISRSIANLSDDLKHPFSLYVSGYKYHEISDKLDIPLGTVKSRIFFARQELQKKLYDFNYD